MFNVSYGITWLVVKCMERRERGRESGERERVERGERGRERGERGRETVKSPCRQMVQLA